MRTGIAIEGFRAIDIVLCDCGRLVAIIHHAVGVSGSKLYRASLVHGAGIHGKFMAEAKHVAELMQEDSGQLLVPAGVDSLLVHIDVAEIVGIREESFCNDFCRFVTIPEVIYQYPRCHCPNIALLTPVRMKIL